MSAFDGLGEAIAEAVGPGGGKVSRYEVVELSPLALKEVDGDRRLEQGDEDFEVDLHVLSEAIVGDLVLVAEDPNEGGVDYVATALLGDEAAVLPRLLLDPENAVVLSEGPTFVTPRWRLRDMRWAGDFGMKFNGDEETEKFQTAILECRREGRKLHLPEGVTGVVDRLVNPGEADELTYTGYHVEGAGKELSRIESEIPTGVAIFGGTGKSTIEPITPFLADAAAGQRVIEIDTTAQGGLLPGDLIHLEDHAQIFYGASALIPVAVAGEVARVLSVDSATQATVYGKLDFSYPAVTATWHKPISIEAISLSDVTIRQLVWPANARGISISQVSGFEVWRVRFERFAEDPIRMARTTNFRIMNSDFYDNENLFSPYSIGVASFCQHGLVQGNRARYGRHFFTTVGNETDPGPAHITVALNRALESQLAAFDTHSDGREITFRDNEATSGSSPVGAGACHGHQIRGRDCRVYGAIAKNCEFGIYIPFGAHGTIVEGGMSIDCEIGVNVNSSDRVRVQRHLIERPKVSAIYVAKDASYPSMTNLLLREIDVIGDPSGPAFDFDYWDPSFRLEKLDAPDATTKYAGRGIGVVTDSKLLVERTGQAAASGAGMKVIGPGAITSDTANTAGLAIFEIDPVDYGIDPEAAALEVLLTVSTNAVAPGQTFAVGLYPVTAVGGATNVIPTLGAVVAASVATVATPAANQVGVEASSGDFLAPAAGKYVLGFNLAGAMAANSAAIVRAQLVLKEA